MRKLGLKDAFAFGRILKIANIQSTFTNFAREILKRNRSEKLDAEQVGLDFIITLFTSVSDEKVENKIYELYADIKGCEIEAVKCLDFASVKADIKQLIEENDLEAFFKSASAMT